MAPPSGCGAPHSVHSVLWEAVSLCPFLGQARPALTDVVKASWCQPLRQMGGEEEASKQRAEEVVDMAGAQYLLPTVVAPAPAQSKLAKEKQGWWGGMLCGETRMCGSGEHEGVGTAGLGGGLGECAAGQGQGLRCQDWEWALGVRTGKLQPTGAPGTVTR